jgi:hypothetical protein
MFMLSGFIFFKFHQAVQKKIFPNIGLYGAISYLFQSSSSKWFFNNKRASLRSFCFRKCLNPEEGFIFSCGLAEIKT